MKKQTLYSSAALLFGLGHLAHANPLPGIYNLADAIDVRNSVIVLSEATHGAQGWAPVTDTFSGSISIAYTMTPKLLPDTASYSNFSQYFSFMLLRKDPGDFRLGTGHANPVNQPVDDFFAATLLGTRQDLLVGGEPIRYEDGKPFEIEINIVYMAGGNDTASVTIDGFNFPLNAGDYTFKWIDVLAVHDQPGPGADFTNMRVTVIPEPRLYAMALAMVGFAWVLWKRRRG